MASLSQIFSWFETGDYPTEQEFRETFLSFFHKSEKIPVSSIEGLQETPGEVFPDGSITNTTVGFLPSESDVSGLTAVEVLSLILFGDSEGEVYTTEVEFEIETTEANQTIEDLFKLSSSSNNGKAIITWDLDNEIIQNVDVPEGTFQQQQNPNGTILNYIEGTSYAHTFGPAGKYTIRIISNSTVDAIDFSTKVSAGDWSLYAAEKPYITKILKFKSSSLESLYYTFAGLVNCTFPDDFVIECPNVSNVDFSFFGSSTNVEDFIPPATLFSQITLPVHTYRIFMGNGLIKIPEGLFDTFSNCTKLFETFRWCPNLGNGWYQKFGDTEFIPTTLFQNMHELSDIEGIFNYIGQGYFGHYESGYNYLLKIKRDLFKNTKISRMRYAFNKCNRVIFENDTFGWIKNYLSNMEGAFNQENTVMPFSAYETLIQGFTNDLASIFPDATYPAITNLISAFCPFPGTNTYSFNGNNQDAGGTRVLLDALAFVSKFPNCGANSTESSFGTDGRKSAIGNLSENCTNWGTVSAIDEGIWTNYVVVN
jgi:hypothetical protein